jgi:hypothetical protein
MTAQAEDLFAGLCVPDLDFPVGMHGEKAANCGKSSPVGTERHSLQVAVGVTARDLFPAGLRVPHLHHVIAASDDSPTVGAELNTSNGPVEFQRECRLLGAQIPDLQFPLLSGFPTAGRGQVLTVRAKGDTPQAGSRVGVFEAK